MTTNAFFEVPEGLFNDVPSSQQLEGGQYLVKLIRIEPAPDGQFGARRSWVFAVADANTSTPIYNADGSVYEYYQLTSDKLGSKARAREWAEALLDRPLVDGEKAVDLVRAMIGKRALGLVAINDRGYAEIVRLTPLRGKFAGMAETDFPI
jgi:hypothetical protein